MPHAAANHLHPSAQGGVTRQSINPPPPPPLQLVVPLWLYDFAILVHVHLLVIHVHLRFVASLVPTL